MSSRMLLQGPRLPHRIHIGTLACSCQPGPKICPKHQDCCYVPKLSTLKSTDFLEKGLFGRILRHSERHSYTDMSMICMLPPTTGSFGWSDTNELWSKIWNMEPLWPCVSSCKLCGKTGSFCIFSMNSFFSWCSTTCALTQHVHRQTQKRRLFHNMLKVLDIIWQNNDQYDDICIHMSYFTNLKRILPDICEHDLCKQQS